MKRQLGVLVGTVAAACLGASSATAALVAVSLNLTFNTPNDLLGRPSGGPTLYILDEPTTGLHTDDVGRLLRVLQQLVELGHTVLVIEHHLEMVKCADWVIDLGPDGGAAGGEIVVAGTPSDVAACDASHTGRWLREILP